MKICLNPVSVDVVSKKMFRQSGVLSAYSPEQMTKKNKNSQSDKLFFEEFWEMLCNICSGAENELVDIGLNAHDDKDRPNLDNQNEMSNRLNMCAKDRHAVFM
jgi:hypothetical protein